MVDDKLVDFSYVGMVKNMIAKNELNAVGNVDRKVYTTLDTSSLEDGFLGIKRNFPENEFVKELSYSIGGEFSERLKEFNFGVDVVNGKIRFGEDESRSDSNTLLDAYRDVSLMKSVHSDVRRFYVNKGIEGVSSKVDCMYLFSSCAIKTLELSKKNFAIQRLVLVNSMSREVIGDLFNVAFR